MLKSKKLILICLLLIAVTVSGISLAWLPGVEYAEPYVDSAVLTNYFESGTGTQEDPYIIHTQRHLYNLAWLQYMGQFNKVLLDNSGNPVKDTDGNTVLKQCYFKMCAGDEEGHDCPYVEGERPILDMAASGAEEEGNEAWILPPIGNKSYPFIGYFDGNGVVIKNAQVSGRLNDLTDKAMDIDLFTELGAYDPASTGCDIVGLFGVVGSLGETAGTITKSGTTYTYTAANNTVTNVALDKISVVSGTEKTLAGIVAGYVNGLLSTIRMADVEVNTTGASVLDTNITANVSDFSSVGYADSHFKSTYQNTTLAIAEPQITTAKSSATGIGNNWGGSLDMRSLLNTIRENVNWGTVGLWPWKNNGGTKTKDGTLSGGTNTSNLFYVTADDGKKGAFALANGSGIASGGNFAYLSGGVQVINGYQQTEKEATAYIITDGQGHYLNFKLDKSGSSPVPKIENGTDESIATRWTFPAGGTGAISTVLDNVNYYLNADLTNRLVTASTTAYNSWSITQTGTPATGKISGRLQAEGSYSVLYDGQNWSFQNVNYISSYVDGQTHYLGVSVTPSGTVPKISETKTQWIFEEISTGNWKIYTYYNSTPYYLVSNTATEKLTLTTVKTNASVWKLDTGKLYTSGTFTIGAASYTRDYFIDYESGWILAFKEYYAFTSGEKRLGVKAGSSGPEVTNAEAGWDIYNNKISIRWNGEKYFLCNAGNGKLSLVKETGTIQPTSWTISDTCLMDTSTGEKTVYIFDNPGWQLMNPYTISNGSVNLGANDNLEIINGTSYWFFVPVVENNITYYYICTNITKDVSTSYYFLGLPTGTKTTMANTLSLSKNASTKWQVDSDSIKANINGKTFYLYYHGISYLPDTATDYGWRAGQIISGYKLFYSTNSGEYLTNLYGRAGTYNGRRGSSNKYDGNVYKFTNQRTVSGHPCGPIQSDTGDYLRTDDGYLTVGSSTYEWIQYTKSGETGGIVYYYHEHIGFLSSTSYYSLKNERVWQYQSYLMKSRFEDAMYDAERKIKMIDRSFDPVYRTVYTGEVSTITKTKVVTANMPSLTNESDLTFIETKQIVIETVDHFWDYNRTNVTYIPIRTYVSSSGTSTNYSDGDVLPQNTGYIVGGSQSQENGGRTGLMAFPYKSGDVRFGRRTQTGQNSIGAAYVDGSNNIYNALTIGAKGQASVGSNTYPSTMFQKYSIKNKSGEETGGARPGMTTILQNSGGYVYGLHFMDAELSSDYLVTTTKATVEHATYAGYELPNSCVDVQLQSGGFINFFAGTYYQENDGEDDVALGGRNNAFFSLHQIIRYKDRLVDNDGNLKLSVMAIYNKSGSDTIYKCNDGDFYKLNGSTHVLEKTIPTDDFDTAYTQFNTKVFMNKNNISDPLYYLCTDGNYYSWTSTGLHQETGLASNYIDAMKVVRGSTGSEDGIREISKIYAVYSGLYVIDAKKEFIYQYKDGNYSKTGVTELPNGDIKYGKDVYQMAFNTAWMTDPTSYTTSFDNTKGLYYFEIPTNRGEYALGSVKGKIGAYLIYLDVSANASTVGVQTLTEMQKTTVETFEYPLGVQFTETVSASTEGFSDIDSAAVALKTAGNTVIKREDDAVICNTTSTCEGKFAGNGITLEDSSGTTISSIPLTKTEVREEKELHYLQSDGTATTVTKENFYILYKEIVFNDNEEEKVRTVTYVEGDTSGTYEDDGHTLTFPVNNLLKEHAYRTGVPVPTEADTVLLTSISQYSYGIDTNMKILDGTMVDNVTLNKSALLSDLTEDVKRAYYLLTNKIDATSTGGDTVEKEMKELNITVNLQ